LSSAKTGGPKRAIRFKDGRLGPAISHLLFAIHNIFFARSDRRSVVALRHTLNTYCQGSGQKTNLLFYLVMDT
jgi:hypothetical protein